MLALRNLVKVYPGPVTALQGVDLDVPGGMFGPRDCSSRRRARSRSTARTSSRTPSASARGSAISRKTSASIRTSPAARCWSIFCA